MLRKLAIAALLLLLPIACLAAAEDQPVGGLPTTTVTTGKFLYIFGTTDEKIRADLTFETAGTVAAHAGNNSNPHVVTKTQVGLSLVENIKHAYAQTIAPPVTADSSLGYVVGKSLWLQTTGEVWVCTDATTGAAVWKRVGVAVSSINCPQGEVVNAFNAATGAFTCISDQVGEPGGGIASLGGSIQSTQTFIAGANITIDTDEGAGTHTFSAIGGGAVGSVNTQTGVVVLDADDLADGTAKVMMTVAERNKLTGVATSANNYTHPANHPPSIISQDASNRFVTDGEKNGWSGKQDALGFTPEPADPDLIKESELAGLETDPTVVGAISTHAGTQHGTTSQEQLDIADGVTAHGWGDHAGAGYLTTETDDQTAAEVSITDTGLYFPTNNVEAALQEIGPTMTNARTPTSHNNTAHSETYLTTTGSGAALTGITAGQVGAATTAQGATADTALQSEADPIAGAALTSHETTHPAPTNRDVRNQVAGSYEPADADIQTHISATGNAHSLTIVNLYAIELAAHPKRLWWIEGNDTTGTCPAGVVTPTTETTDDLADLIADLTSAGGSSANARWECVVSTNLLTAGDGFVAFSGDSAGMTFRGGQFIAQDGYVAFSGDSASLIFKGGQFISQDGFVSFTGDLAALTVGGAGGGMFTASDGFVAFTGDGAEVVFKGGVLASSDGFVSMTGDGASIVFKGGLLAASDGFVSITGDSATLTEVEGGGGYVEDTFTDTYPVLASSPNWAQTSPSGINAIALGEATADTVAKWEPAWTLGDDYYVQAILGTGTGANESHIDVYARNQSGLDGYYVRATLEFDEGGTDEYEVFIQDAGSGYSAPLAGWPYAIRVEVEGTTIRSKYVMNSTDYNSDTWTTAHTMTHATYTTGKMAFRTASGSKRITYIKAGSL